MRLFVTITDTFPDFTTTSVCPVSSLCSIAVISPFIRTGGANLASTSAPAVPSICAPTPSSIAFATKSLPGIEA